MKALEYATAVQQLRGLPEPDPQAIEAYREIVGAANNVASRHVIERLDLEPDLRPLMAKYKVAEPYDVLTTMRKAIYGDMIADPQTIRDNQWPHTVSLLRAAREKFCRSGLETMSQRDEALHVLRILGLETSLDLVLAREDVTNAKPDPEIYLLASEKLEVPPDECLVLEDSPQRGPVGPRRRYERHRHRDPLHGGGADIHPGGRPRVDCARPGRSLRGGRPPYRQAQPHESLGEQRPPQARLRRTSDGVGQERQVIGKSRSA